MRRARDLVPVLAALGWTAAPLGAQGTWDAILMVDPIPSPYLSDWEANPSFGTLTVFNGSGQAQEVRLVFNVVDGRGRLLAQGASTPQRIPADAPSIFDSPFDISGSTRHDTDVEAQMRRTGRLPEGDYRACVAVVDRGGFQLAEACESFSVVYPDPPLLVAPLDREVIHSDDVFFQWTPSQVPLGFAVRYVLAVAEIQPGQLPAEALRSNILHLHEPDVGGTQLLYPLDAQPLRSGARYAWRVQALDVHGYPVAANDGSSQIWTFKYDDAEAVTPGPTFVTFSLFNAYDAVTEDNGEAMEEDGDGAFARTTSETQAATPTEYGLTEICDRWSDPPTALSLGVNAPFGFRGFREGQASLFRLDDVANRSLPRKWWVFAQTSGGRAVLLHGNCNGPLSGLQWIASRKIGRNQRINEFFATRQVAGPIESVEYGVFIVALRGGTVSAEATDQLGSTFLGGREIDVGRGLNVYIELNLREHSLWETFQTLGYDQRQIVLQGFMGLDVTRAVGVGLGDNYEASVSQERSFLLLTAALPERQAIGPLASIAESMRLSFEFEIKDSTGVNVTTNDAGERISSTKYSREFIFRIKHTINLRDDLFRVQDGSRALVGWIGADIAGEREQRTQDVARRSFQRLNRGNGGRVAGFFGIQDVACAPQPDLSWKVDLVISYGLEGKLYVGPLFFEDPALEVHIGPKAANGQRDLSFALSAHIGVEGYEQRGILGISRVRSSPGEDPDEACRPTRPRANATAGITRPRADARAAPRRAGETAQSSTDGSSSPAGPLQSPWKWNWKVAWEVIPLGAFSKAINAGLAGLFIGVGLGGGAQ